MREKVVKYKISIEFVKVTKKNAKFGKVSSSVRSLPMINGHGRILAECHRDGNRRNASIGRCQRVSIVSEAREKYALHVRKGDLREELARRQSIELPREWQRCLLMLLRIDHSLLQ